MEKRSVTSKIRSELRVADETESFHFQDNVHVEAVHTSSEQNMFDG